MKQITEDYVSYETAKLLKEKGFINDFCRKYYNYGPENWHSPLLDEISNFPCNHNFYDGKCSAPTHQVALKWLREVCNIHIEIYRTACGYLYIISNIPYGTDLYNPEYGGDDENSGQWTTYEKAVEAAILYVLKNLI